LPKLFKYLKDNTQKAKELGYTRTLYGRKRNIKELFSNIPFIRAQGERIAMNAPVQGTAADIVKWAMIDFKKVCHAKGWGVEDVAFLLQIHDEILFEVKENLKDEVEKELKIVMENVMNQHLPVIEFTNIPLVVNIKSGKNWGQM
jgi:DNA polymerase I